MDDALPAEAGTGSTGGETWNWVSSWFPDPTDPATFRWGWWRLYPCHGNAVRSHAFAASSGRLPLSQLDANYLAKCITTITNAANDTLNWSGHCAYGSSFPQPTKQVEGAGWYFSASQAFDIAVAYQLNPAPAYLDAMLANVNYEGGCNPVNASYMTGLGWKHQRRSLTNTRGTMGGLCPAAASPSPASSRASYGPPPTAPTWAA